MKSVNLFGVVAITAVLGVSACSQSEDSHVSKWGYVGDTSPEHWGDLSAAYAACSAGQEQSPIDIEHIDSEDFVETSYAEQPLAILNNGHTIQLNVGSRATMQSGDDEYALLQVHFHTPSEHTIDGKQYPLVAHFVHQNAQGGLGVLGVLFEEGTANSALTSIIPLMPTEYADVQDVADVTWQPSALLPGDLNVYRYAGSLTTPPCTEGVAWHVVKQAQQASADQIATMSKVMGANARPVQAMNERTLQVAQ